MTDVILAGAAGVLLSLIFAYVPGLRPWYAGLDGDTKRLVMLGALVVVALAVYGLSCAGWDALIGVSVTCDQAGAVALGRAFVMALIANQAAFPLLPAKA